MSKRDWKIVPGDRKLLKSSRVRKWLKHLEDVIDTPEFRGHIAELQRDQARRRFEYGIWDEVGEAVDLSKMKFRGIPIFKEKL